jgi:hypothetical protein
MSRIAESPTAAPVPSIAFERDMTDASSVSQAAAVPLLAVRRDMGEGPSLRPASAERQARLSEENAQGQALTPDDVRAALSKEYPRLDIRLGGTYAHPWEAKDSAAMVHGWINDNGEVVPFDS